MPGYNYNFNVQQPNLGNIMAQTQQVKNLQQTNQLNAMKLRDYPAEQAAAAKKAEFDRKIKGLELAVQSGNNETAKTILTNLGMADQYKGIDVEQKEVDIKIYDADSGKTVRIKMPKEKALQYFSHAKNDKSGQLANNPQMAARVAIDAGALFYEETPGKTEKTPTTAMAAYLKNNPNATEDELVAMHQKLKGKGTSLTVGEDGSISFSQGGANLNPPVATQLQKDVVSLEQQLADLKVVASDYSADYLTRWGKGKRLVLNEASKLGIDVGEKGTEFVQGARRLQEGVEQSFNAYRKEITGAQAAMKEITMLRDSILNKKLSPVEFEASMKRYEEQMQRHLKLKKYYLSKGITDSRQLGEQIDNSVVSGQNAIDLRGDEIEKELSQRGIPQNQLQQEVLRQLKTEGYY